MNRHVCASVSRVGKCPAVAPRDPAIPPEHPFRSSQRGLWGGSIMFVSIPPHLTSDPYATQSPFEPTHPRYAGTVVHEVVSARQGPTPRGTSRASTRWRDNLLTSPPLTARLPAAVCASPSQSRSSGVLDEFSTSPDDDYADDFDELSHDLNSPGTSSAALDTHAHPPPESPRARESKTEGHQSREGLMREHARQPAVPRVIDHGDQASAGPRPMTAVAQGPPAADSNEAYINAILARRMQRAVNLNAEQEVLERARRSSSTDNTEADIYPSAAVASSSGSVSVSSSSGTKTNSNSISIGSSKHSSSRKSSSGKSSGGGRQRGSGRRKGSRSTSTLSGSGTSHRPSEVVRARATPIVRAHNGPAD